MYKRQGGSITNIDNKELNYNNRNFDQKGLIIASNNKDNHKNICKQIKLFLKENKICIN